MTSAYLYRTWSDQSYGINSEYLFAPAAAKNSSPLTSYTPKKNVPTLNKELDCHLKGRTDYPDNLFVDFTTSFLFALLVALYKQAKGETRIYIICIDVKDARTPGRKEVAFRSVQGMVKELGFNHRNKSDDSVRDYDGCVISMECVVPGANARIASLDALIAKGLYQLYPPLQENSRRRHDPRLQLILKHLRKYWFPENRTIFLTWNHVTVAAKVAAAFESSGSKEKVPTHILTYILAFHKRDVKDSELESWLDQFSEELVLLDVDEDDYIASEAIFVCGEHPELAQYRELREVMKDRYVRDTIAGKVPSIGSMEVHQREYQAYMDFKDQERADYRAAANPARDRKRRRRYSDDEHKQGGQRRLSKRSYRGANPRGKRGSLAREAGKGVRVV